MKDKNLKNHPLKKILNSLWLGPLGAFLAVSIGAPIPFLIGPTAICSIAAFLGFNFVVPTPIRNLSFIIIGLTIGSNVTPDSLIQISKWPISLIFMTFSVLIVTVFGAYFLNNILWLDKKSSVLAASPGHLSFVLSISTDINGETAKIAVIQSTRVLILTFTTPLMVAGGYNIRKGIGTAAACGIPIAAAGAIGYMYYGQNTDVNLPAGAVGYVFLPAVISISLASIFTAKLGANISHSISEKALKISFGLFLIVVGIMVITN